jgi:pyruvate kinase
MPKTKIVCTIGPASGDRNTLKDLILKGMNVARLNFSHGLQTAHKEKIDMIREISQEVEKPIAILQDLSGPKIRVGKVRKPGIALLPGQDFILTTEPVEGEKNRVSVSYANLPKEVGQGDRILLADGLMDLEVRSAGGTDIHCTVITGGLLTSNKGINIPTGSISIPSLTDKDKVDLLFGLQHDVDYVALSFVRNAADIEAVKHIIAGNGKKTPVIAKMEKHEAIENADEILDAADGIMVARGDLGVEIPLEKVPGIQKMLVTKSNQKGKPVIIATQMLRSMINSPRPTRAEATDVANAVLDGADAVMLSEETAVGDYPVEAVHFMARIIKSAEEGYPHSQYLELIPRQTIAETVAYAACIVSGHLDAAAVVATTRSGSTAVQISRFRPRTKIIALSPDRQTVRRLTLHWGCNPYYLEITEDTDEMIESAADAALKIGKMSEGDLAVITAGRPLWAAGTTNILWVKKL